MNSDFRKVFRHLSSALNQVEIEKGASGDRVHVERLMMELMDSTPNDMRVAQVLEDLLSDQTTHIRRKFVWPRGSEEAEARDGVLHDTVRYGIRVLNRRTKDSPAAQLLRLWKMLQGAHSKGELC